VDDLVRVLRKRHEIGVRMVVRAERSGIDRMVTIRHSGNGVAPTIEAGPTCRIGRQHEGEDGLVAVELPFDAPLTRGELYPLSYRLGEVPGEDDPAALEGGYHGSWTKAGLTSYDITVDFGEDPPSQVYRVWLTDPPVGFHGIRWET